MISIDAAPEEMRQSAYVGPLIFERLLKGLDFFAVTGLAWMLLVKFGSYNNAGFLEFSSLSLVFLGFLMLVCLRALKGYRVSSWVKPIQASILGASCAAVCPTPISCARS